MEVPVTEDGKVTKVIKRDGTGALPSLHASCLGEFLQEALCAYLIAIAC